MFMNFPIWTFREKSWLIDTVNWAAQSSSAIPFCKIGTFDKSQSNSGSFWKNFGNYSHIFQLESWNKLPEKKQIGTLDLRLGRNGDLPLDILLYNVTCLCVCVCVNPSPCKSSVCYK